MNIRLCHGTGDGKTSACLMMASSMLVGRPHEKDENSCVCPVLREFIVPTNDHIPLSMLDELYGPLVEVILNTSTCRARVQFARGQAFADWAIRKVLVRVLKEHQPFWQQRGTQELVGHILKLPPLTGQNWESAVLDLDRLLRVNSDSNLQKIVASARDSVVNAFMRHPDHSLSPCHSSRMAAQTVVLVADFLRNRGVDAFHYENQRATPIRVHISPAYCSRSIWALCPEIIRHAASLGGPKPPVRTVMTLEQLASMLSGELEQCHATAV